MYSTLKENLSTSLSATAVAVINTIIYFDIFRHPLTTDEIHRYCQWNNPSLSEVAFAIEEFSAKGILEEKNGFWFLSGKEEYVDLRGERMARALRFQKKAKRFSSFISSFPFVEAVFISGSLSKGTMDRNSDIDYFIITRPGRLWVARTFLVLFKKVFLLNSKKYFCVNYFVDSHDMSIPDRNLFVATEIIFLKAMRGGMLCEKFLQENKWAELFYPNTEKKVMEESPGVRSTLLKRMMEKIFSGKSGDRLDNRFWKMTLRRWKRKFPEKDPEVFENKFRSKKNTSKHHPNGFQQKVISELSNRRYFLESKHRISIPAANWEWKIAKPE
ncbi:MAG: nucleotidyltransferase domain-containing protein [Bacteroidetes bacterium]|nr:nucleotidyltransferase domain-containing protein [Bacteroidota bacterium]